MLVLFLSSAYGPRVTPRDRDSEREREGDRQTDSGVEFVKGEGTWEEVGGDKHVSRQHMCVHRGQGGRGALTQNEALKEMIGQRGQRR